MDEFVIIMVVFLGLIGVLIFLGMIYMSRYRRPPPDKVMVVWGPFRHQDGYDRSIISGRGSFIIPVIEKYDFVPLDVRTLEIDVRRIPVTNPIPDLGLNVKAVTQIKLAPDNDSIQKSVDFYLNKPDELINQTAIRVLELALREEVSKMTIEQVNSDRDHVSNLVQKNGSEKLKDLGIEVRAFVIKELDDDFLYLDSIMVERSNKVKVECSGFIEYAEDPEISKRFKVVEPPIRSAERFDLMADQFIERGMKASAMQCLRHAISFDIDNIEYRMDREVLFDSIKQSYIDQGYYLFRDRKIKNGVSYQISLGGPVDRLLTPEELEMRRAGLLVGEGAG